MPGTNKLAPSQITNIAISYANGGDAINTKYLASMYNVSITTISRVLHTAISEQYVNKDIAKLIAKKADRHYNLKQRSFGYAESTKVLDSYKKLIYDAYPHEDVKLVDLEAEYKEIEHLLDNFDEKFSASDEFPYTEEELILKLTNIKAQIESKGRF